MRIVDNKTSILLDFLTNLKEVTSIKIAAPFIDLLSIKELSTLTDDISIITDLSYISISPSTFEFILDNNYEIMIFTDNNTFHGKLFLIETRTDAFAILGSSNCTVNGLQKNIELNVVFQQTYNKKECLRLLDLFNQLFNGKYGSIEPLTQSTIIEYTKIWRAKHKGLITTAFYSKKELYPTERRFIGIPLKNRISILDQIENYRDSDHYDYSWHKKSKDKATVLIKNPQKENLERLITDHFMPPRGFKKRKKEYLHNLIQENELKRILESVKNLNDPKLSLRDRLNNIFELNTVGLFVGSQIWTGLEEEDLVVYHENIEESLRDLFKFSTGNQNYVASLTAYIKFNDFCKQVVQEFAFKDITELHAFLWDWRNLDGCFT